MGNTGEKIDSSKNLHNLIQEYYQKFLAAKSLGIKTAWLTSQVPAELFYAAKMFPFFPENYAALCAARHFSTSLCEEAEISGFHPDLCSYARTVLGSVYSGKGPFGPLPVPDLLVACNNQCSTVVTWWKSLARYYHVPCIIIDTPPTIKEPEREKITYVENQLQKLLDAIVDVTGRPIDENRLEEAIHFSNQAQILWGEMLNSRQLHPSPINAGDVFTHMFAAVSLGGTEQAVRHYKILLEDIEERRKSKEGAVKNERFRFHWDNIPIWFDLRLFTYFGEKGAVFVSDTYSQAWLFEQIVTESYLQSFAKRLLNNIMNISMESRNNFMIDMLLKYQVDGVVMHSNRSCKLYSAGHLPGKEDVRKQIGIPCLIFEGDMNDPRNYSKTKVRELIDVFLGTIENGKQTLRKQELI